MVKVIKTIKIQGTDRGLYLNIPKDIKNKFNIRKGQTAIMEVTNTSVIEVRLIEKE